MAITVILAILSAFLLLGISYILFPDQTLQQPPAPLPTSKPENLLNEVLWAIQWIGLAAIIAITIVGAVLLVNRVKSKKTDAHIDNCAVNFKFRIQTKISQYCKVQSILFFNSFKQCLVSLLNLNCFRVFFH